MYDIDLGKTDLSLLEAYLIDLKKRAAVHTGQQSLGRVKHQLETIFTAKGHPKPIIPWGD